MKANFFTRFFTAIVFPRYQTIALLITSSILLFMVYQATREFRSLEPMPQLFIITPEKISQWAAEPTIVKMGLHIINFPEFNLVDNEFIFDGIIWFEFDPAFVSLDTIGKFSFEKGEILRKLEPDTKLINGKLFAEYNIRIRFSSNLSHEHFPLDDHRIYIVVINEHVLPSGIIFQADKSGFSLSENLFLADWVPEDQWVTTGYAQAYLDKHDLRKVTRYPKTIFSMDFRRLGISQILLIFLPLFLMLFISLFVLGFDPAKNEALIRSLASASVASMIAYRFIIQRMSPKVGYFILSDHIFMLFLAIAFITLILSIIFIKTEKLTPPLLLLRGIAFLSFHLSLIVVWYYLLFIWV